MEPTSPRNCEISSGILDLDRIEDFGELDGENMSFQKSAMFNPGEIAGRSTCTEDLMTKTVPLNVAVEKIANIMDTQTSEVNSVMRTSICDSFSFHSKRNLTADEESFMRRDGPVPVHPKQSLISEDTAAKPEDISVGSYFLNRCGDFGRLFKNTDSPDRSNLPSICDGKKSPVLKSSGNVRNTGFKQTHEIDESLDCVPVRQPRDGNNDKMTDRHKNQNQQTIKDFVKPVSKEKHRLTYSSVKCTEKSVVKKHAFSKYASTTINPVNQYINNPAHYNSNVLLSSCQTINSPFNLMTEENESSENSISLSKIADYIAKQSEVSVTEFLNNKKKQQTMKSPLSEVQMNVQDNLVDYSKSAQSSATAGTLNTIMSFDKMRINYDKEIPEIVLTGDSISNIENVRVKTPVRSRSSSSKSPSTLSTVQDNYASFRQSEESGSHSSKGKGSNASNIPSANTKYTELDKSVDWRYLMGKGFEQRGLAKEKWIEIVTTPAKGFVGVECTVIASVTNLTDSWLTAKFQFESLPNDGKDLCIELPRQPLLLTPGKNEQFNLHITSTVEMKGTLQLSVLLKDTSIERDTEVKQVLEVDVRVPIVQAMSPEGMNKITFPPIQETGNFVKCFVLVSDCPADLQLELSVVEGDSIFAIRNVQEITRTDIKKVLMERQRSTDEGQSGKAKGKALNKQLCRLTSGNAIKVTMKFSPPKLSDLHIESLVTFNGLLHVNLIGVNSVLRNIDLVGVVGCTKLVINTTSDKLFLTNEPTNIVVSNTGTVPGGWVTKFSYNSTSLPFKAAPARFDICPGGTNTIMLSYTGSEDNVCEGSLSFEDMVTGQRTTIEISGGPEKSRTFPIKTNFSMLSWVRAGRKELSLKNSTDKRVQVRCQVIGEGFSIDLPGGESRGIYSLQFGPCECRPLSVVFAPKTMLPQHATLVLVFEKNGGLTRKIKLFGCASGEPMRWSGLVTYGDTALVRAVNRSPIHLELYNKSTSASFVCAQIHFNVQYCWAEQGSRLAGGRSVVRGKARHRLAVSVEWERVERRARHGAHAHSHAHAPHTALATLRVLTGHELTRRRILKIIRNESRGNEIDTSLLPEHLKVLTEKLDGEDPTMDELLEEFEETKGSLGELISGLHELTAQIDLPQDYPDEATIVINDETIIEHHTLCE